MSEFRVIRPKDEKDGPPAEARLVVGVEAKEGEQPIITLTPAEDKKTTVGRITVRQGQPSDRSVVLEQVHDAPIGQGAHRDAGDFLEGGFVVERGVQQATDFGQDLEAPLCARGFFAGQLSAMPSPS